MAKQNVDVKIARDGDQTIQTALAFKPDLIVLDILMPKKGGIDTLKELKRSPVTSKIPVIVASNVDNNDVISECKNLGAVGFFVKSHVSINELVQKCQQVIGG